MANDEEKMTPPPKRLELSNERVLRMPYAMLMDINRMLPDPATAINLMVNDPVTQDYVVRRLLTPLDKPVKSMEDLIPSEEVDLDIDDVEKALTWAMQHVLYFFAKRTDGLRRVGQEYQLALPTPSSSGSETSASTAPSAGPSTA